MIDTVEQLIEELFKYPFNTKVRLDQKDNYQIEYVSFYPNSYNKEGELIEEAKVWLNIVDVSDK